MKQLKLILLSATAGFMLNACSGEAPVSQESSVTTADAGGDKKVLAIGSDMTFPPYEYLDEQGKPQGVDVEIMAKMAELNGDFTPEWEDTRWANLIPGLKGGKFDVLYSSMYITKDRLEQIDMIPYYKTDISLLVRGDSDLAPRGANDLCGHNIGAMKGTEFANQLREISKKCESENKGAITIKEYETSPQTTQALMSKAVDIQYDDAAVMTAAESKLGDRVKITSTEEFYPIVGGIGVRKGDTETYDIINGAIEKMKASGDLAKILGTYGLTVPSQADIDNVMN
ncbi:ABC transporter substrate-binding protein [Psychrobacter aestuarii]|uniref:ABC transporter substrate-binding protein n=1 Tax=Psychrobacter aestuarii TaxID=556327 RepID=A0ABN0VR99_9GAMM|nr:ABC transporter substrate-binding protein [Psychrobacter aestuarii]